MSVESIRPFFHGIASAIQLAGLVVLVFGSLRVVRAPSLAARRAAGSADQAAVDVDRYARGLTDFYRISGALAIVVGIILLLVPIFAS